MTTKIINAKKYNALKHGVSSKLGLLPWETNKDYELLQAEWRKQLRPHGAILKTLFEGIVRNRWQSQRNRQAAALFVTCHPFGRAVAEVAGDGNWSETASKLLGDVDAQLMRLIEFAKSLGDHSANFANADDRKRLLKAAETCVIAAQRIGDRYELAVDFFLGLGDEIRKQADRDAELNGKLNKLLTGYFQVEQMLLTREKYVMEVSRQSLTDDNDGFADALPEKSESKEVHPAANKDASPNSERNDADGDDWDTSPAH
jgi:hypothetical protein